MILKPEENLKKTITAINKPRNKLKKLITLTHALSLLPPSRSPSTPLRHTHSGLLWLRGWPSGTPGVSLATWTCSWADGCSCCRPSLGPRRSGTRPGPLPVASSSQKSCVVKRYMCHLNRDEWAWVAEMDTRKEDHSFFWLKYEKKRERKKL